MNKIIHLLFLLTISLPAISQEKIALKPIADSYTYSGEKSLNNGQLNKLKIMRTKGSTVIRHSYLKFDISTLNPSRELTKATFKVYINSADVSSEISLEISECSSEWDEAALNWTNQPKQVKRISDLIINAKGTYFDVDLTEYLKQAVKSRAKEISFRISDPKSAGVAIELGSKESSNAPILEINL